MKETILVAPIVIDKLREIKYTSSACCSLLRKNRGLKDVEPYEATRALEEEIKGAAERVDAALYILEDLLKQAY